MQTKVYLAGAINGCSDSVCNDWRTYTKNALGEDVCVDPMRRDYRGIEDASYRQIVRSDEADIDNCYIVLANCPKPSWGTAMEIHYAYTHGKAVFAVVPSGKPVSPWLRYHANIFESLDAAIHAIMRVL